jgi:hypothetical protein
MLSFGIALEKSVVAAKKCTLMHFGKLSLKITRHEKCGHAEGIGWALRVQRSP